MDNYILPSQANTGKILLDEDPIIVIPALAVIIGDREAMFLQQIHYWLNKNEQRKRNFKNGRYWTYNTFEQWQLNFPWLSVSTLKRIVEKLKNRKLLITGHYNKKGYDRTTWYTINYEELEKVKKVGKGKVSKWHDAKCQNDTMENVNLTPPLPETYPEDNTERGDTLNSSLTTKTKPDPQVVKLMAIWRDLYKQKNGNNPTITAKDKEALDRLLNDHGFDKLEILLNEYLINANEREANESGYKLSWLPGAANRLFLERDKRLANEKRKMESNVQMVVQYVMQDGYDYHRDKIDQLSKEGKELLYKIVEHHADLPENQEMVSRWREPKKMQA